jgi:hypothetical protein
LLEDRSAWELVVFEDERSAPPLGYLKPLAAMA